MDVNVADRIRIVVLLYLTCWINIRLIHVLISVRYPSCGYPYNFLISTNIHGYPQVFTKKVKINI